MDSPEGQLTTAYDPQTKQLSALTTEGGQQTSFTHDGPLQTAQTYDGEVEGSVALTYDNLLRLSGFTTPAGSATFTYDRDSLLTSAGGMSLTRSPQTGLITSTSVASATTTTAYNQFAEPTTQTYAFPGGAFSETYERDNAGRIAAKNVTTGGSQSRYVYTYDPAGRLTDVTKDGNPWRTYTYDANSNRTSVTRAGEPAEEATFDAQDKMMSQGDHELSFNTNGELTQKQSPSSNLEFTYTSSGQLKEAETADHELTFSYDALGNRTIKKVDGATTQAFLYAPGILGPIAQLGQGSSTETRFVYASRTNVPDLMVRGGTTYRLITDQLGSVRLVVNASTGAVAQEIEYDPFGEVIDDSSPGFQPFGFAGGLYDHETRLTHFGAREYDAELGRWTSRDPIGFAGGDANLYGYVVQDPVNWSDPSGLLFDGILNSGYCVAGPICNGMRAYENAKDTIGPVANKVQRWAANKTMDPNAGAVGKGFAWAAGLGASLFTCENFDSTALTVGIPGGGGAAAKSVSAADKVVGIVGAIAAKRAAARAYDDAVFALRKFLVQHADDYDSWVQIGELLEHVVDSLRRMKGLK